jgi:hypothetical protein
MSQPPPEPLSPLRRRQVGWRFGMIWFFTNALITSISIWTLLAVPANPLAFLLGIVTLGAAQGAILSKYFRNGFNVIRWAIYTFIGGFISVSIFILMLISILINFHWPSPAEAYESSGRAYVLTPWLILNLICISAGMGTTGLFQSSKLDRYSAYAGFWLLTNILSGLIIAVIISFSGEATWVYDNYISIEIKNLAVSVMIGVIYALMTCGAMILIVRRPQDPDVVYWRHQ